MEQCTSKFPDSPAALPRPALLLLALLFCAATSAYAITWIVDQHHPSISQVEIGINQAKDTFFNSTTASVPIYNVIPNSPAERAGLRPGDQIIAINGHALESYALMAKVWSRSHPGGAWVSPSH